MPKLLVIDKSVFHGAASDKLIKFAKNNSVVLPYALAIECLMSEKKHGIKGAKDPIRLLHKVEDVVKAGAYCGRSPGSIFQEERERQRSVDSVVDEKVTRDIREGHLVLTEDLVEREADICRNTFDPQIVFLKQLAEKMYGEACKKGLQPNFRGEAEKNPLSVRLTKWIQVADVLRDQIMQRFFSTSISSNAGPDWFAWQWSRLCFAWAYEWTCKRVESGPSVENRDISNDLYDMHCTACLVRADGLLTKDEKLVKPLAQAAFPRKDVFSSLDEVPEEYLCRWS